MGDGEIAVNSTVNSKAFDSTNPIYIFAIFCYTSFGNSKNTVTNSFVATVEIGFFCPPKCTGKEAKKPDRKKPRILTKNCTLKLLHTLNQQQ